METLKKEDFEILKNYEKLLYIAKTSHWTRVWTKQETEDLQGVYFKYRNDGTCKTCPSAKLRMLEVLAAWYYDYKEEEENKEISVEEADKWVEEGRPKKATKKGKTKKKK